MSSEPISAKAALARFKQASFPSIAGQVRPVISPAPMGEESTSASSSSLTPVSGRNAGAILSTATGILLSDVGS